MAIRAARLACFEEEVLALLSLVAEVNRSRPVLTVELCSETLPRRALLPDLGKCLLYSVCCLHRELHSLRHHRVVQVSSQQRPRQAQEQAVYLPRCFDAVFVPRSIVA